MTTPLRIIVTGLAGLYPVGGVMWDYLQYVIGLARLGHDVYYHEDTWSWPYHPLSKTYTSDGSYSANYIREFFDSFAPELSDRWHYLHLNDTSFGMDRLAFDRVARTADVFLNVSGACAIPEQLSSRCIKVFLDTDPGYNQIVLSERFDWSENVDRWCATVAAHDQHFTYAENLHSSDCVIPHMGFKWKTTRMPVVLDLWRPVVPSQPDAAAPWTTVTTWNAFKGKLIYRGVEYGSKGMEFEKLIDLPQRLPVPFKVAVGGVDAPIAALKESGWLVEDGPTASQTPEKYQEFIFGSRGEISPAKNVYVATRSGWFSCRSACYLASGKPVVVQDTGFSVALPVGEGILQFATTEEAVAGILEVETDYVRNAKAARAICEEYFDSSKVLARLIDDMMSA